jgi:NAD(P)-dependent dehydrogenase (short-subunit alcohol dehydrogenase family)
LQKYLVSEKSMTIQPVALVTGTSTGIGQSAAIYLARANFHVIATMRDLAKSASLKQRASSEGLPIEVRQLDVQHPGSIQSCIDHAMKERGRIDVLVNNAGAGFLGSTEQTAVEALQRTIDINFFGVWRCTQAVLPHMRAARSGRIISISSIGGLIGQPFNDAYCAAKFAVEGMMESLAPVAKKFGVHVSLVEPGPVNTEFVASVVKQSGAIDVPDYAPMQKAYLDGSRKMFATAGQTGDDIAAVIVEAATAAAPHLRYLTSDMIRGLASRKYVDTTGDSIVALTGARLP